MPTYDPVGLIFVSLYLLFGLFLFSTFLYWSISDSGQRKKKNAVLKEAESGCERWLQDLGGEIYSCSKTGLVWRVDLSKTQITDDGLVHLAGLTNLKSLLLRGTQITDDAPAQHR